MSAVIRVDFGTEPRVLLTGDLDLVGLDHLLDAGVEVSAPILVFPHHGGRTRRGAKADENATFTERLMHAVQPRVVIFSIGRGMNATPRPEIVEAVRTYGGEARVVCTQLSEHCASELPSQEPSHLEARFARGRTRRSCCAGSIVIPLDPTAGGPDACMPTAAEHALFISEWAPVALCRRSPA
jgi:hypothetical protein